MKILLGTKNKHKIIEIKRIIKEEIYADIDVISLNDYEDVEEPIEYGKTFEENAQIKARYYYNLFKLPTITDDSGISSRALKGEPGIYSARYASNSEENSSDLDNRNKLLMKLEGYEDRFVYYTCAVCYYDGKNEIIDTGISEGTLLNEEIGTNGFGYDCIFYSHELNKPMGLASDAEKDSISHRAKALKKLLKKVKSQISTKL